MTMVLHGESGVGKSWLGSTAPRPLLILDLEGRAKHVPGTKTYWDPLRERPPENDGSWEICIVPIHHFGLLDTVYQWLRSGDHPFKSVSVDSLMEAQKRFIDDLKGLNQMATQDWGTTLRTLEKFVRDMRDIVSFPESHLDVVVIVTGSVPDDRGVARPLLQGQLKNTVPYFVDVVAWYSIQPNPEDPMQMLRVLNVGPTAWAVAKDGTGKLGGPMIYDPNLTTLYNRLFEGASS
jgi:hypothetical protein